MRKYLLKDAQFSEDGLHRLWLMREWAKGAPALVSLGVNPSTADSDTDDHTITKEVGFAERWGFGSLWKVNLFTRIATRSHDLLTIPRDQWNVDGADRAIAVTARFAERLLIAYGRFQHIRADVERRAIDVRRILKTEASCPMGTLGRNSDGSPPHPLMLPYSRPFVPIDMARI
jgi:hypothetical protein